MSPDGDTRPRPSKDAVTLLFRALPQEPKISTAERRQLKEFVQLLSERVAGAAGFDCLVTNDCELQRLNHAFLGHDYPTDVLSFPSGSRSGNLGEIAISLARAHAQAAEFGHTSLDEIRILMLHGVLHLTGLDHERDHGEMARAERKWRTLLGLPSNLIARSSRRRDTQKSGAASR